MMGRGPWLLIGLLLLGLAMGLGLGLYLTWGLWPVEYYDTDPVDLKAAHKEEYIVLISQAYALNGDLELAKRRLAQLGEEDAGGAVVRVAERYMAEERSEYSDDDPRGILKRSLARLAKALGVGTSAMVVYLSTPTSTPPASGLSPTPTRASTPVATPGGAPTLAATPPPTAATGANFAVVEKRAECEGNERGHRIIVHVRDENGEGIPGVEVQVSWDAGTDAFYTGLRPGEDAGYADFEMQPGQTYAVTLPRENSEIAQGLSRETAAQSCPAGDASSWQIVFRRGSGG